MCLYYLQILVCSSLLWLEEVKSQGLVEVLSTKRDCQICEVPPY